MKLLWIIAFGLLGSSFLSWLVGVPPTMNFLGVHYYPQMALSGFVVGWAAVMHLMQGGTPTRPV